MKKLNIILFFAFFSTSTAFTQISGDVIKDNRKLLTDLPYEIEGHITGKITIEFSIDASGDISASKVLENESTIKLRRTGTHNKQQINRTQHKYEY